MGIVLNGICLGIHNPIYPEKKKIILLPTAISDKCLNTCDRASEDQSCQGVSIRRENGRLSRKGCALEGHSL